MQHRIQRHQRILAGKRLLPGRHFVHHHAKGKQVAAEIDFLAARLLRRHVNCGPGNHPHRGQRIVRRRSSIAVGTDVVQQLGQAEIEHLHLPARSQENVRRLDIPMHDSLGMRRRQRVRHLDADIEHALGLHRLSRDGLLQALALQLLHHNEGMAAVILNAVNSADVRMIQQRRRPRLPREAFQRFGVAHKVFRDELQGDMPPQLQVLGLVNHAHTTAPELSQDAIVGYGLADHEKTQLPNAVMLGPPATPVNWPVLIAIVPKLTTTLSFCVAAGAPRLPCDDYYEVINTE